MKSWKKVSSRVVLDHERLVALEDMVEIHTGKVVPYLRFQNNSDDSVTAMCVRGNEILLQKEYSYPVDAVLYQFPGGKIEKGEDSSTTVRRELLEESGYVAKSTQDIGWYYPNNRRSNAKMFVFVCQDVTLGQKIDGDPEESIESMWVTFDELRKMVREGKIVNYSILAALGLWDGKGR